MASILNVTTLVKKQDQIHFTHFFKYLQSNVLKIK